MKNQRFIAILGLILGALLLTATAAAGSSDMKRPFDERLTGTITAVVEDGCGANTLQITFGGTGNVTHLGRVTWSSTHCTYLLEGRFGDADLRIKAANGDQLFATYEGVPTGPTTFEDHMIVLGGTGRFEGASGQVAEQGSFNPDTGAIQLNGTGWISYDPRRSD